MKAFPSPADFARFLYEKAATLDVAEAVAFEKIGNIVAQDAKHRIGEYQDEAGQFPAWKDLAESTIQDKESQGYAVPAPLLRDGDMRDSIEFRCTADRVVIGSASKVALWQELGTSGPNAGPDGYHVPPRPFLGPALFTNEEECAAILGAEVAVWLAGFRPNRW